MERRLFKKLKKENKGPSTWSISSINYYNSTTGPGLEKKRKYKHSGGDDASLALTELVVTARPGGQMTLT